ncbi:MAG TPA: SsrA-binding protein SmpB [Candidatus Saccharimonadaceae bacterium]|nr:SsrA-binding protein SmpB [Candidatus Saccharimonadaceae bacterium]
MSTKKQHKKPSGGLVNRRARFDYELGDEIVAGMVLTGPEVRAARDGHIQLKGSFVTIRNHELWLNNASFSMKLDQRGQSDRTVDTAPRKLLASHKQIARLEAEKKSGLTIVPTKLLTQGRYIKIAIALGKGKKRYDKRETMKRRDQEREASRRTKY